MIIIRTRDVFGPDACLSVVRIDYEDGMGPRPFGFGVEDEDRGLSQDMPLDVIAGIKVRGETAIPVGTYSVGLEQSGKYGPDTPTVLRVPGFRYIRYHAGNDDDDTAGCMLHGKWRDLGQMSISESRDYSRWLVEEIRRTIRAGRRVVQVIERDPAAWAAYQGQS